MNGFTPNNNTNVIRLLSEAIRKCNKGRNRILMGAVVLCILTLTFVFGTAYGKINARIYEKYSDGWNNGIHLHRRGNKAAI